MVSVLCGNCGATLNDRSPSEREPCPVCGSMQRSWPAATIMRGEINLIASASVIAASLRSISVTSNLLLQAIIVPGERVGDGLWLFRRLPRAVGHAHSALPRMDAATLSGCVNGRWRNAGRSSADLWRRSDHYREASFSRRRRGHVTNRSAGDL